MAAAPRVAESICVAQMGRNTHGAKHRLRKEAAAVAAAAAETVAPPEAAVRRSQRGAAPRDDEDDDNDDEPGVDAAALAEAQRDGGLPADLDDIAWAREERRKAKKEKRAQRRAAEEAAKEAARAQGLEPQVRARSWCREQPPRRSSPPLTCPLTCVSATPPPRT